MINTKTKCKEKLILSKKNFLFIIFNRLQPNISYCFRGIPLIFRNQTSLIKTESSIVFDNFTLLILLILLFLDNIIHIRVDVQPVLDHFFVYPRHV